MDNHPGQGLKIGRQIGLIVSLVALFFVGRWLYHVEPGTWSNLWHLSPKWMIVSLGLLQIWFCLRFWAWEYISHRHGYAGERHENLRMWAMSEILRYIPGNIWSFAGRYRGARQGGVERGGSIQALILEAMGLVIGAAIVSSWTIGGSLKWLTAVVFLMAVFFGPKIISRAFRLLKKTPPETLARSEAATVVLLYISVWLIFGLAHGALFQAMRPLVGQVGLWPVISVSVFSWLIGYVSLITPMGLGVREAAMVKLLESRAAVGVGPASLAVLISRLWLVISEVVFIGLVMIWSRNRK